MYPTLRSGNLDVRSTELKIVVISDSILATILDESDVAKEERADISEWCSGYQLIKTNNWNRIRATNFQLIHTN